MTRILIASLVLFTVVAVPLAQAEELERSITPTEKIRELRKEKTEELLGITQEKRELERSELTDKLLAVHSSRLEKRYAFYHKLLERQIEKLQTRISRLEEKGVEVDEAQKKLDEAKIALEKAKSAGDLSVDEFKSMDVTAETSVRTVAQEARQKALAVKTLYQEVAVLLKEVLKLVSEAQATK